MQISSLLFHIQLNPQRHEEGNDTIMDRAWIWKAEVKVGSLLNEEVI